MAALESNHPGAATFRDRFVRLKSGCGINSHSPMETTRGAICRMSTTNASMPHCRICVEATGLPAFVMVVLFYRAVM